MLIRFLTLTTAVTTISNINFMFVLRGTNQTPKIFSSMSTNFHHMGSSINDAHTILPVLNSPPSHCPHLSVFCLATLLSLSVQALSWMTNKELQKLWKNKISLKMTCTLLSFLVCLIIFQSVTQEDDHKMTFICPLLLYRDHTEKDVHLQLNPLPPLSIFVHIVANPLPSPRCGHPL